MKKINALLAACLLCLPLAGVLSAASSNNPPVLASPGVTTRSADPAPLSGEYRDYKLRYGDLIEVKVYGEDDLTARARLNENGMVELPLLPGVSLNGLTQTDACERIRQLYMKDYLLDPLVSLTILEYGKSKVTVLGQVRTPGVYLYPANERLNLLQAIALAGGYTRAGEPKNIVVKRAQDGKENVIRLDGKAMAKDESHKMFEILPDDVITIAESLW